MTRRFFSIIVPAYNEERIIEKTLAHLTSLKYPKDCHEIIVVENGSTDSTFALAKRFESENCHVYQSEKGVSRARNFGIARCSENMDWAILLDADTFLKEDILNELQTYLDAHLDVSYGTTDVFLDDTSRAGRFWSWYINCTDKCIKIMHRLHIVRKELLKKVCYDESIVAGEDLLFSRELSKHGKYFFMPTNQVITSARRFRQKGYLKMFFLNMQSGMPKWMLRHISWEAVR